MSEGKADDDARGAGASASAQAELRILAQYVRDLSFENPGAPQSLAEIGGGNKTPPQIDVSVGVTVRRLHAEQFEAELKLHATARRESVVFMVEVVYGGLFLLRNLPEESVRPLLNIECPRLLFPYARRILADAVRDGGFPPLMLDPIDFAGLYRSQLLNEQKSEALKADTPAGGNA